jgi:hypothetical protein
MAYKPVTRVITIEFRPLAGPGSRQEIDVTPEYAEVRSGDTIVWDVQGAPAAAEVLVRNIAHYGAAARVAFKRGKVTIGKPKLMNDGLVTLPKGNQKKGALKIQTKGCEPGAYKYDVTVDGTIVLDPEVEIKGPRGS